MKKKSIQNIITDIDNLETLSSRIRTLRKAHSSDLTEFERDVLDEAAVEIDRTRLLYKKTEVDWYDI